MQRKCTMMTITEIMITGEAVVEVMTGMNVTGIVRKTERLGAVAGVVVLVLTILKDKEEAIWLMIGEVLVDQEELLLLALSPWKSPSPHKGSPPRGASPDSRSCDGRSPSPQSVSPRGLWSPSPRNSDVDEWSFGHHGSYG